MNAKFITLEGVEGVGKTTNIKALHQLLTEQGIHVMQTREPGGTPFAEEIRGLLLRDRDEQVSTNAELLLMFAARAQHLEYCIKPALAQGQWVLCDRFTDATYAYQGGGRQLPVAQIQQLEQMVQGAFRPDAVIVLDIPVEMGLQRAASRSNPDRIEQEHTAFFERVRAAYLERAAQAPDRYHVIDASGDLESVHAQLANVVATLVQAS